MNCVSKNVASIMNFAICCNSISRLYLVFLLLKAGYSGYILEIIRKINICFISFYEFKSKQVIAKYG